MLKLEEKIVTSWVQGMLVNVMFFIESLLTVTYLRQRWVYFLFVPKVIWRVPPPCLK